MINKNVYQPIILLAVLTLTASCQFIQNNGQPTEPEIVKESQLANQVAPTRQSSSIALKEVTGWNHVSYFPQEFKKLSTLSTAYHLSASELSYNNVKRLDVSTILVRKIANWERQHSNGILIDLSQRDLTFGQLEGLSFDFALNGSNTVIPTPEQAKNFYASAIDAGDIEAYWLEELLIEPANLTITLFGENHKDQRQKTAMASYTYAVSEADEALTLAMSLDEFSPYWQENYQVQATELDKISVQKLSGILFTADTGNNKTLRSYLSPAGQQSFPWLMKELFIELDISLSNLSISTIK